MTQRIRRYEALELAAREFIRKVDTGEARSTRSYNQFKLALALPRDQEFAICDEYIEIVSMLQQTTKMAVLLDLETARSNAVAELAEGDLSIEAEALLKKHVRLAKMAKEALEREQAEINDLDKRTT